MAAVTSFENALYPISLYKAKASFHIYSCELAPLLALFSPSQTCIAEKACLQATICRKTIEDTRREHIDHTRASSKGIFCNLNLVCRHAQNVCAITIVGAMLKMIEKFIIDPWGMGM